MVIPVWRFALYAVRLLLVGSLNLSIYTSIYINHIVGSSVCVFVCLSALNLQGLKSHDHETWHVGSLSDLDVHGPSGILIFGRVAPQVHAA